eukprot:6172731-Pleurochrysis_carterae.AAC.1
MAASIVSHPPRVRWRTDKYTHMSRSSAYRWRRHPQQLYLLLAAGKALSLAAVTTSDAAQVSVSAEPLPRALPQNLAADICNGRLPLNAFDGRSPRTLNG